MSGTSFHCTLYANLEGIAEHGLLPAHGGRFFAHGIYGSHGYGKVFFGDTFSAARSWFGKVADLAEHHFGDDEDLDRRVVVMLRADLDGWSGHTDRVGEQDIANSSYVTQPVPPERLEWWDPVDRCWRPMDAWGMRPPDLGVRDWDEEEDEETGEVRRYPYFFEGWQAGGFKPSSEQEAAGRTCAGGSRASTPKPSLAALVAEARVRRGAPRANARYKGSLSREADR